jgi:transposase
MEASDKTLRAAVTVTGTRLLDLYGIGPASAARILGDLGNVARFAFWNGTAPLDASSGEQQRHRLSRAGNRRINTAILAIVLVAFRHVDGHGDDDGGATLRDALPPLAKLFSRTARGAACLFDHARSSKWAAQAISRSMCVLFDQMRIQTTSRTARSVVGARRMRWARHVSPGSSITPHVLSVMLTRGYAPISHPLR